MKIHLSLLLSDWIVLLLVIGLVGIIIWILSNSHLRLKWSNVFASSWGMFAAIILSFFILVTLLDSIHFQFKHKEGNETYSSVLDLILTPAIEKNEATFSSPFSLHSYSRSIEFLASGKTIFTYPRLDDVGVGIANDKERNADILKRISQGLLTGLIFTLLISVFTNFIVMAILGYQKWRGIIVKFLSGRARIAWRTGVSVLFIFIEMGFIIAALIGQYHIFGTDQVGTDVFYLSLKSVRTGVIIGTFTTLIMLPFSLLFGTTAGYFRGVVDDVIQYLYTTLSSIPAVLLIVAMVLVLDLFISRHSTWFDTLQQRADIRLLALCFILGITSWATLCRLIRGETLKIRQMEFVQAANNFGVSHLVIIGRHIVPNVMHIVLITLVLDFSGLVLMEAVLSYVGVGVDPTTISWGNMINGSRLELSREPIVWWPLVAAFIFMFSLVLAANIFADAVRDAFDPRVTYRREGL